MLSWLINPLNHADSTEVVSLIRRGTMVVLALLWLLAVATFGTVVWLLVTRGIAETQATAAGLEQYARRNIELGDFVTDAFADYLNQRGGVEGLDKDTHVHPELYRLNKRLPQGSSILLVLPDGQLAVSTRKFRRTPVNLSDRRWFKAHVEEGARSYVGPAISSRVVDEIVYTYTKSYFSRDGRLLGIIDLGIPSHSILSFSPHLAAMNVAIVQHEGPLVAAHPLTAGDTGKTFPLPGPPPIGESTVLGHAFGTLSIATMRNLPDLGLYVLAATPLFAVLQPAIWGVMFGFPMLGLFTVALLNLSRLAQRKSVQAEQALADNRMLFQEVHHRVKNNLQVISSLLRMQTDRLPAEFRPVMEQTAARVRAIAMVHEQIYSADAPSVIQLDTFLKALLDQIQASMLAPGQAELSFRSEPVTVGLDQAVPVALLATEAITNAIQHGLKCARGAISVTLLNREGRNELQVVDTGTGPAPDSTGGLGTRIMTALSLQIDGEWELDRDAQNRTVFTLTWPQRGVAAAEA